MYPFYHNVISPARSSRHQPQLVSAALYRPAGPQAAIPPNQPSRDVDDTVKKRYSDSDSRVRHAISHSQFLNPEAKRHCLHFVDYLRVYKHLFMYTYEHLVSCYGGRHIRQLVESANIWKGWDSVEQLTHHSLIRTKLTSFWAGGLCHQHEFLLAPNFVIRDDDSDLLCHLLYCSKKQKLYELSRRLAVRGHDINESEQVVELLWQFLTKLQEGNESTDVVRRLRASVYRMARKSAYLPHALHIVHPFISNRRDLVPGANGFVTKATMDGREVVIKRVSCVDRATQRRCLELFAGEAILWHTLRHKNIVPFLGVVTESTFDMGLVSPFFRNGNIRSYMKECNPKDWPAMAWRFAADLAKGLHYIHRHEPPIVHGDLKGDNVLVDNDGHARLGDFGQSYASDSARYLDSTRVGLVAYNPAHWMAPELMIGGDHIKASDKSDIYSFGCVLYEMISGKIPFEQLSFADVVKCVPQGKRPDRPASISRDDPLWKIAKLCWEDDPKNRPSTRHVVSLLG